MILLNEQSIRSWTRETLSADNAILAYSVVRPGVLDGLQVSFQFLEQVVVLQVVVTGGLEVRFVLLHDDVLTVAQAVATRTTHNLYVYILQITHHYTLKSGSHFFWCLF